VKCWSCQAENDLAVRQTCVACGAPLMQSRSVFSKPVLLVTLLLLMACQIVCVLHRFVR